MSETLFWVKFSGLLALELGLGALRDPCEALASGLYIARALVREVRAERRRRSVGSNR